MGCWRWVLAGRSLQSECVNKGGKEEKQVLELSVDHMDQIDGLYKGADEVLTIEEISN